MEEDWKPEEGAGQDLAHHLHQEGLAGPLQWLENCLRRTAGDREEDGMSHPVPLVPLSEENEDAMEDQHFRALLRQLGLRPPDSEQESFWRIPAALTPQQLRRAAASITCHGPDVPGSLSVLLEPPQCPQDTSPGEDDTGARLGSPSHGAGPEPVFLCPTAEQLSAGPGSDSEGEEPVAVHSLVQLGTKRHRQLNSEDED
ncbi:TIM protein, partial [Bucco capensis]|nr:TIM protein [Bucco capensis]